MTVDYGINCTMKRESAMYLRVSVKTCRNYRYSVVKKDVKYTTLSIIVYL